MIDDIINKSEKYLKSLHNQSEYFASELLQPLTLSHEGKLEPIGNLIKGGMHCVPTKSVEDLIKVSNVKWIAHTHLNNACPSEDDITILFQFNYNYNTNISHIVICKDYIWVINSQKKFVGDNPKSLILDTVKKYSEYLTDYNKHQNIDEFTKCCDAASIQIYRYCTAMQNL